MSFDTKPDTLSSATKHGGALKVSGCHNCRNKEYYKRVDCTAAGKKCHACYRTDHFSPVCNKKKKKKSDNVRSISVHSTSAQSHKLNWMTSPLLRKCFLRLLCRCSS